MAGGNRSRCRPDRRFAAFCPGRIVPGGCSTRRRGRRGFDPLAGMALGVLAHVCGRTDSWVRSVSYLDGCRVLCDPPASSPWGTRNFTSRAGASPSAVTRRVFCRPFRAAPRLSLPGLRPGLHSCAASRLTCPRREFDRSDSLGSRGRAVFGVAMQHREVASGRKPAHKTKRPRTRLSPGASAEQPLPRKAVLQTMLAAQR